MAQSRSPKSGNKRTRNGLDYQRMEDRKLLAADLQFSPLASPADFGVSVDQGLPDGSLQQQLEWQEATASLQSGLNRLVKVATESTDGQTVTVFQQAWNGLPVYGSYVTAVQSDSGELSSIRDRTIRNIQGYASDADPISAEQAIASATWGLGKPQLMDSSATMAWYYAGNKARLSWLVETTVNSPDNALVGEHQTWVDVFSGTVFNREVRGAQVESLLSDPVTETGVFPRIVINDAIGATGSQDFADPFDSVVSISVGCTGALMSPNTVATARHCGVAPGATVSFGEDSLAPIATFSVIEALNPDGPGSLLDGGDFTILTLSEDVPASVATPMRFIDATDELVGMTAVTVGYGWNGVGSTGHEFNADGKRWGGQNVIDAFGTPANAFGSNIISTDFDDGSAATNTIPTSSQTPLTFEATTAPGDSGGPILVDVNGEWVIAGVLSGGTNPFSLYGDISWWTGTAIYRDVIEANGGEFVLDQSSIGFSQDNYFVGDTVNIRVIDSNSTGDISISVTSDLGDSEVLTASPTSPGVYDFTLDSANANIVLNDGTIQVDPGDTITVTYVDQDNGEGGTDTFTDTAIMNAVTASDLIGVDFDLSDTSPSPFSWLTVAGGTNAAYSDLDNEQSADTPVDFNVNGSWTGLDVTVNTNTIPLHPNSLANINGQIQTSGQPIELVFSDLVPSSNYLVYVMAAEGVFASIEQSVTIQGLGSPITFEQRFSQGDLFVNDQLGDNTKNLSDYAILVSSDINGEVSINVDPIDGTQDVVLSGIAIVPDTGGIDAVSDTATTNEDQSVDINVTANDIAAGSESISLDAVTAPENGIATITASGQINYAPNADFTGVETFNYTISDSAGNSATGWVTVTVAAVNDSPSGILLSPNFVREDADTSSDVFVGSLSGIDVDDSEHTFRFVSGDGSSDNSLFRIDGDTLSLVAGTDLDFDAKPQYSVRVEVSDGEYTFEQALVIGVIEVKPVATVSLGDGSDQRSMVTNLLLTFDGVVTFGANPFELVKRGPDGGAVGLVPTVDNSSGQTNVTFTFFGEFVDAASGSLEDGNYQLTVFGDQVTTADGTALDGDADGTAGGNYVFGDTETDRFFRFFGDIDADRLVTTLDLLRFRQAWSSVAADSNFDDRFDNDNDGAISTLDLLAFRKNYSDRLEFV